MTATHSTVLITGASSRIHQALLSRIMTSGELPYGEFQGQSGGCQRRLSTISCRHRNSTSKNRQGTD